MHMNELDKELRKLIESVLKNKELDLDEILKVAADAFYELAREGDKEIFEKVMMAWQQLLLAMK